MAEIFFYISWFAAFSTVLLKKRSFDLFTIAIVIGTYYASPLFFGTLYDPFYKTIVSIIDEVYWFYTTLFISLLIGMIVFDSKKILPLGKTLAKDAKSYLIFFGSLSFLFFLTVIALDPDFFLPSEIGQSKPSQYGPLYPLFTWSLMISLVFSFKLYSKPFMIIASLLVIATLAAGSRATFANSVLIIAMLSAWRIGPFRILLKKRYVFSGILGFLFLFFFKIGYGFILQLDLSSLVENISDVAVVSRRFFQGGESFLVMLNLQNAILLSGDNHESYLGIFIFKLIPFLSPYYAEIFNITLYRFSDILQTNFYPDVFFGMASTFWGEGIYLLNLGFFGAFIIVLFYTSVIYIGNKLIYRDNLFSYALMPAFVYISFYITRKEIADVAYFFYISIFLIILSVVFMRIFTNKRL